VFIRILILKSAHAIPYTSIFLELGRKYWGEEAEEQLQSARTETSTKTLQSR
jgi:hypothetical protein